MTEEKQYDFNKGIWLMFTPDTDDTAITERFESIFGHPPEVIQPQYVGKYAGPVTEEEEDQRRTKI